MRPTWLAWMLTVVLATTTTAAPPAPPTKGTELSKDAVHGESTVATGEGSDFTIFNDIKVPPMTEIEGANFADTIKSGYWYAKKDLFIIMRN